MESAHKLKLQIANKESTSSVYPPNSNLLIQFPDDIGEPARRTKQIEEIQDLSIDFAVENNLCPLPDFIKLDVHSSEYEAIIGAQNSLQACCGLLVET